MKRVTLSDIAKEAGVSVATVSLALRGRGDISQQRGVDIRALAERMGYRPNPMLAALASKRFSNARSQQGTPITIFDFPVLPGIERTGGRLYHDTLVAEAKRLGYAASVVCMSKAPSSRTLFRQLYARATQGIVITGNLDLQEFGDEFDWNQFAVVQCARYLDDTPFHRVRPNVFQSIKLTFTKLRERGYERIGCAIGRHDILIEDDEDRLGAALSLEMSYLPKKHRLPVFQGGFNDIDAFMKWFLTHSPDVVLGFNTRQHDALQQSGLKIPEDVGFAILHCAERMPTFSGLVQNCDEIARQSIRLLDQLIRNHESGRPELPMDILIPSTWNEGSTVRSKRD